MPLSRLLVILAAAMAAAAVTVFLGVSLTQGSATTPSVLAGVGVAILAASLALRKWVASQSQPKKEK